jgi:heat shock protein HslJ
VKPIQIVISTVLLFALLLTACSGAAQTSPAPTTESPSALVTQPPAAPAAPASPTPLPTLTPTLPSTVPPKANLQGVMWQMQSYRDAQGAQKSLIAGTQVDAVFMEDGNLGGSGGCNRYNATYQVNGDALEISPIVATLMACPEPEGVMVQEAAYLAALQSAETYRTGESSLELLNADGQVVVTYQESVAAPHQPAVLATAPPAFVVELPASGAPVPASLTVEGLQNAAYPNDFVASGTATLVNGEYHEPAAPGSASETVVKLGEWVAYGELADGTLVAAVILLTNSGGSGTFYHLHLMRDASGQAVSLASTLLGDRVKINSLKFDGDKIVVDMIVQGPEDAMCCPTKPVVDTYAYQDGQLVKVPSQSGEGLNLTGVTWQWLEFQGMDDTVLKVSNPAQYTLELNPDGTLAVKADCNSGSGSYTSSGSQLNIDIQVITMAQCAPESLSAKYVQYLNEIVSYVIQDGDLFLALPMDGGILKFTPAN